MDVDIHKTYPGVLYDATETGFTYFEDREVDGILYRVQNAYFDTTVGVLKWRGKDPSKPAFAIAQNADGSVSHYTKAFTILTPPWTVWDGDGQRGIFDVRDFNAKGDGVTDDHAAIQNAANAVPPTGGIVYLPPGNYLITSTILLSDNTILLGAGKENTTITAADDLQDEFGVQTALMVANT